MSNGNGQLPSNDIIGQGFTYPFTINTANGSVAKTSGDDNIIQSIVHILDVSFGEYPGTRDFGSSIYDLVFVVNDSSNDPLLQHFIIDSLEKWEPRIQVLSVLVNRDNYKEGVLEIGIDFVILQTHQPTSMVYPYYVSQEA